ncbi:MAG: UDP-N-acetylglucosamine 2-epimerase [Lachnospiraceae bacterium]|nr:UDP-N-acetylglucosamine 2-epimerase [Lachnospiraceae bacterium]
MKRKILFLSGTRADYGKMKPLMQALEQDDGFEVYVFVCGMHLLEKFGSTYHEIEKDGYRNIYIAYGLAQTKNMSVNLGATIQYLSGYVEHVQPDMLIVHGDRADALAGAVVGALHNRVVAHIEGGELSGTIDESIRHAVSKFAHVHFVCTEEAKKRLIQIGEEEDRIHVIGSPDIDVMMADTLPSLQDCMERYHIPFDQYGILMYHPVTTEYDRIGKKIREVVDAVLASGQNYIVVYPNNDLGSEVILNEYKRLEGSGCAILFPSLRFEYFLSLLKNAGFIIGNSSAGIRESGIYGIPAIDIGTRQSGRYSVTNSPNLQHVQENKEEILDAISCVGQYGKSNFVFGKGNSTQKFMEIVRSADFWEIEIQKHFVDHDL